MDPEFGTGFPQAKVFVAFWVVGLVGNWVEVRALRSEGKKAKAKAK